MASEPTTDVPMATGAGAAFLTPTAADSVPIPRLEQGDHLTMAEFERRYEAMPDIKKAELIEGVVHMPSPVRMDVHAAPHSDVLTWFGTYRAATPGVHSGGNATLRLDNDNMPQPDGLVIIDPALGGQAKIDTKGYVSGAPEMVAEIAASTASIDMHSKLKVYRRSGVREYIVWRVLDRAIDWFILREDQFALLVLDSEGIIRSETFPGLWLNVPAMLEGKLDVVLATLQQGIATQAHQDFVARLASQKEK